MGKIGFYTPILEFSNKLLLDLLQKLFVFSNSPKKLTQKTVFFTHIPCSSRYIVVKKIGFWIDIYLCTSQFPAKQSNCSCIWAVTKSKQAST